MSKNINQIELEKHDNRNPAIGCADGTGNDRSADNLDRIAHDVRGSINVVICYAQLLLDGVNGKINDEQRRALQDILTSGNRLYDLLGVILKRLENESENK